MRQVCKSRLHTEVRVAMLFTLPRAKGPEVLNVSTKPGM